MQNKYNPIYTPEHSLKISSSLEINKRAKEIMGKKNIIQTIIQTIEPIAEKLSNIIPDLSLENKRVSYINSEGIKILKNLKNKFKNETENIDLIIKYISEEKTREAFYIFNKILGKENENIQYENCSNYIIDNNFKNTLKKTKQ